MAYLNYQTTVAWTTELVNIGLNAEGLAIDGQKITAGAPQNTAGKYIGGAFIQNIADGQFYRNSGSTAVPNFVVVGGGGGTPAGANKQVQFNNAGAFGASPSFVFDLAGTSIFGNLALGIGLSINSITSQTSIAGQIVAISNEVGDDWLQYQNAVMSLGDLDAVGNSTRFVLDDNSENITNYAASFAFASNDGANPRWMLINNTGLVILGDVDSFGNDNSFILNDASGTAQVVVSNSFRVQDTTPGRNWLSASPLGHFVSMGDLDSAFNDTLFRVDDSTQTISATVTGAFVVQSTGSFRFLNMDTSARLFELGDKDGFGGSTRITVDDANTFIRLAASSDILIGGTGANSSIIRVESGNRIAKIGDVSGLQNATSITVNDVAMQIVAVADDYFQVENSTGQRFLFVEPLNQRIFTGDIDSSSNGFHTIVDDSAYTFSVMNGIIGANALHDNPNVAQGTAINQQIRSGTYTPTLSAITNVTSTVTRQCQWMRVGNVVTVSGQFDVTPTGNGLTVVRISLPVASDFGTAFECGGAGHSTLVGVHGASIIANAGFNLAELSFINTTGAVLDTMAFTFTYEVI